jgi:hypothetical protein
MRFLAFFPRPETYSVSGARASTKFVEGACAFRPDDFVGDTCSRQRRCETVTAQGSERPSFELTASASAPRGGASAQMTRPIFEGRPSPYAQARRGFVR